MGVEKVRKDDTARTFEFLFKVNWVWINTSRLLLLQHLLSLCQWELDKARILVVSAPHAGDWLHAIPLANCGILLDTVYVFEVDESIADILTELSCLRDLESPSQLPVREVLMILSYEFLKFSHYSCFQGQGIHCWYFYRATMFGSPRKSR